mgnify:CR=1 FL=1
MWKKNKKNYSKTTNLQSLRILSLLIVGIIGVILIFSVYFLYEKIFITISQSQAIFSLDPSINIELINFNKNEQVDKAWKEKYIRNNININRDPFYSVVSTTIDNINTTDPDT